MDMANREKQPFRFTGRHMLAIMVAFFGVIITVNVTMAIIASGTWTGLVVKNSYVASQGFNDRIAAFREQERRGWQSEVTYSDGRIEVEILDATGTGVVLQDLKAWLGRPAFEQQDRVVAMASQGGGRYSASIDLDPGAWLLRLYGVSLTQDFRYDVRLTINGTGQGALELGS